MGDLIALRALNLSHNELQGHIPPSVRNLPSVESLDLSSNHLEGKIPEQLTSRRFLQFLNLSHNQLQRSIPTGRQFATFENNSYTAAETPPMRKSVAKVATPFSAGAFTNTGEAFAVIIDRLSPHVCPKRSSRIKYQLETSMISIHAQIVFAARAGSLDGEYIGYNNAMLFLASYGDYWRKIRKIVINEVLSSSKLEKLRDVRVSEVQTSIKDLYSLFPITGDQNLDFPVTADHFPVTRDNLPVDGDDISFIVDGDNVIKPKKQPLTEIQGKDSYNKVFLSNPSLDPTHGGSFSAKGDKVIKSWKQPMVEMQGKASYNSAHSDCFSAPDCLVSGANLDFPVT
ncbi:Cytochrome 82A4 [Capsicum chinense]|nr:Cytochrome 82A4 [Capsicum chinense]